MSTYKGRVYLAPSGEWAFKFYDSEVELGGGAGFQTEAEAKQACRDTLQTYGEAEVEVVEFKALPPIA